MDEISLEEKEKFLNEFCKWLENHGYLDSDWWSEEPKAVEEYLGIR